MVVVRFPKLSELQEAMADLVVEAAHAMPVVAAIKHIDDHYESGAIENYMGRDVWMRYCIRKMERLEPDRNYIFQKPAKMNAKLLDLFLGGREWQRSKST